MSEDTGQKLEVTRTPEEIQSMYHAEIQNSKGLRQRAQAAESALETLKAEATAKETAALAESGKFKELYEGLLPELKTAKERVERFDAFEIAQRDRLLKKLPEDEWDLYRAVPLEALDKIVDRLGLKPTPKELPPGSRVPTSEDQQIAKWASDPRERVLHWSEIVAYHQKPKE